MASICSSLRGLGFEVRLAWARNASIRAGRYWMRLSRLLMMAASWSTSGGDICPGHSSWPPRRRQSLAATRPANPERHRPAETWPKNVIPRATVSCMDAAAHEPRAGSGDPGKSSPCARKGRLPRECLVVDLEKALEQFDTVEANLRKLKRVFHEMSKLVPRGIAVIDDESVGQRYRELLRSWYVVIEALPPIGDYQITSSPLSLDELNQARSDAEEAAQPLYRSAISFGTGLDVPWQELQEYEARLRLARRELVCDDLIRLMGVVDPLVPVLVGRVQSDRQPIVDKDWDKLVDALGQVERLTGGMVPRQARWRDMHQHLSIGQGVDLHDIARLDWPSVRAELQASLYSELEPLPVEVDNMLSLVRANPSGPVTTKLNWDAITAEDFERVISIS